MIQQYFIVSVTHTNRAHRYVTVWRPNNAGYAWPLSWAGRYDEETVRSNLRYYNNGDTIAVRAEILDKLAVQPAKGTIDGDAGPVVPNNAESWRQMLAAVIEPPRHKPQPVYRGARRRTETASPDKE